MPLDEILKVAFIKDEEMEKKKKKKKEWKFPFLVQTKDRDYILIARTKKDQKKFLESIIQAQTSKEVER